MQKRNAVYRKVVNRFSYKEMHRVYTGVPVIIIKRLHVIKIQ